jgi:hypothetical protein
VSKARLELAWPLRAAGSRPGASTCCATSTNGTWIEIVGTPHTPARECPCIPCAGGEIRTPTDVKSARSERGVSTNCTTPASTSKGKWSGRRESNPHLLHGAEMLLSIELQPHVFRDGGRWTVDRELYGPPSREREARLELAAPCLEGRPSGRLRYSRVKFVWAQAAGVEPATGSFGDCCSPRLSYACTASSLDAPSRLGSQSRTETPRWTPGAARFCSH